MVYRRALILSLCLLGSGCASMESLSFPPGRVQPPPPGDAKSLLALDQIPPPAALPRPRPATRPDVPPPVESLALYAAARDAMIDNHPLAAVDILRKAIAIDPDSFELYRAMGESRLAAAQRPNQEEIDAFEQAAELRPDDLRLQALLGAQCAAMGQADKALLHLRLATLTHDYPTDDVAAAAVDLLLARLLQVEGYDRAALDQYQALIQRLASPSYDLRSDPELGSLAAQPQLLLQEVAALEEKQGRWADALAIYQPMAAGDPSDFEVQARVIRMLANLGRTAAAIRGAADLVMRFDATGDSINLLEVVCLEQNVDVADALQRLLRLHPSDGALELALAQVLSDRGNLADARQVLVSAESAGGGVAGADWRILSRLFDLDLRVGDVPAAARLLVEYLAAHPDSLEQVEPWWSALISPSRPGALRIAVLQRLRVSTSAIAARDFLIWRLANVWRRDSLAQGALEEAVRAAPPFAPAYRQLLTDEWSRDELSDAQKLEKSQEIARLAGQGGDAALAMEVRGLAALGAIHAGQSASSAAQDKAAEAISFFEQALAAGGSSDELTLTYANALRLGKQDAKAEQILLQLVQKHPRFEQGWEALFQFYLGEQAGDSARKTLAQWLGANPASVSARVLDAEVSEEDGDVAGAEQKLLKLFADHDSDPDVITALAALERRTGHMDQLLARLEDLHRREPTNLTVVEWLVEIDVDQSHLADGARVLDETRKAVAGDPDLLYNIAHLYERVNQPKTIEDVLSQVVALDPQNASACNDLGFTWADEGRNLPRAQALILVAVTQEPDNQSFLDSMGWVLYKQARYAEAETYFQRAVGPAAQPDPVVLDHYGDVLYRLGRASDAVTQWKRALAGLAEGSEDRDDLRDLRMTVLRKLSDLQDGRPVSVAPIGAAK